MNDDVPQRWTKAWAGRFVIIALALMTGVQGELRDRIVGSTAHVYVYKRGGYQDVPAETERLRLPGVTAAAPAIAGLGLMSSSLSDGVPVQIKGIDPAREPGVTDIRGATREGSLDVLATRPDLIDGPDVPVLPTPVTS